MDKSSAARVLIIAGSDSGGGAGIQADIKTCAAFGAYSLTAITAITAQNTNSVDRVDYVDPDMVKAQIECVMDDIGADVIKIGMLGTREIIDVVAEAIKDTGALVVLDPVMVATSGDKLIKEAAINAMRSQLVPLADIITPNVPEAEVLTGIKIEDMDDLARAGQVLLDQGAYAALMKGGHLAGNMVADILVSEEENAVMTAPRLPGKNTHGTGCTLASALAANLALGRPLEEAVTLAREFVYEAIRTAPNLGDGKGPLNHGLVSKNSKKEMHEASEGETPKNPFSVLKTLKVVDKT